ncbi:MAG: hypothetical protein ACHRXM_06975 [Isosphaerales bacterium]
MAADMGTMAGESSAQTAAPRRRFQLADAMILTAATAAACGVIEWISRVTEGEFSWLAIAGEIPKLFHATSSHGSPAEDPINFLVYATLIPSLLAMPFVAMWTLALIPIRLLGPRPRFRRLSRQPGMMATCAFGVAMAFLGLLIVVPAPFYGWEAVQLVGSTLGGFGLCFVPSCFGLAVLVSWMTLLVGRRWRAESSWVDRSGRAVGVFWIVEGLVLPGLVVVGTIVNSGFRIRQ